VSIILGLAISEMHVTSLQFGYRCNSYELEALGYTWVT
jgi:hypothetical protein